jgi:hypothetical protein
MGFIFVFEVDIEHSFPGPDYGFEILQIGVHGIQRDAWPYEGTSILYWEVSCSFF